jgi:FkbM family methyltransferase
MWPEEDTACAAVVFDWLEHLDLALKHVKEFGVAVQAGGNCGVWPKHMGTLFDTVYTFEPEPRNFYCLAHNCPEENIIKLQAGLGAWLTHPKALEFVAGQANLGAVALSDVYGATPVLTIDALNLKTCDLIQLDVEGYEPNVLAGASRTINRFKPVIMVEDKGLSVKYGYSKGWSDMFLADLGYRIVERAIRDVVLVCDD